MDAIAELRAIPLQSVLLETGAHRDRYDKAKWHTAKGAISITGVQFINWNHGAGGGGAIDLAMHLNDLDFKAALNWLRHRFPSRDYSGPLPARRPSLTLPPPDSRKLSAVKHYLVHHRAIPLPRIESLAACGSLYADARGNAVFLLLGKENRTVGAELRGTGPVPWRGMAPGSHKDLGYFSVRPHLSTAAVILCESAIDAISCSLLHPEALCISTSGARPCPRWLPTLLSQSHLVYCAFDADPTGDATARQMIALFPAVRRLRPTEHDWNDILRRPLPSTLASSHA